jgi:hypothetical protein
VAYDEKTAERVRHLLAGRPDIAEKKMMGGLCFMLKGAICCTVSGRGGIMVRVGPDVYQAMLAEPHVEPVEMRGRPMTGFVRVRPEGYRTPAALKMWIDRGVAFVAAMPAEGKSGKRKAPARKRKTVRESGSR